MVSEALVRTGVLGMLVEGCRRVHSPSYGALTSTLQDTPVPPRQAVDRDDRHAGHILLAQCVYLAGHQAKLFLRNLP